MEAMPCGKNALFILRELKIIVLCETLDFLYSHEINMLNFKHETVNKTLLHTMSIASTQVTYSTFKYICLPKIKTVQYNAPFAW